jgi:hypothetical protein
MWAVIGGTESVNNWDKYLSNLKNAGLDEVLAELNELYPQQQKELEAYLASRK